MTALTLPYAEQYEAIKRSRATDVRLARRLGLPVDLVMAARQTDSRREAIEAYIVRGTRVRLDAPMSGEWVHAPSVGECGTAEGSDAGGKLFVAWDGGSFLALMPGDQFSLVDDE